MLRGKALETRVERESITMREVFGGGCDDVEFMISVRRWARVGVKK